MENDTTPILLTEYVVRAVLSAECFALITMKSIGLYFYLKRQWATISYRGHALEKMRARHTVVIRAGNIFIYAVFCVAILANTGRGVSIWQLLFIAGFAVTGVGVYQMMTYEMNMFKAGIHETQL